MTEELFVLSAGEAQAYGVPHERGFLVRAGSTAMRDGTPKVKRNRPERDRLLRNGVLVPDANPAVLRFAADHVFTSPSQAGGVVKDGNCSGPQSWKHTRTGRTLKSHLEGTT